MATVVPPGYTENVSFGGARRISTLDGKVSLDQNAGKFSIRDATTNMEIQVHDRTGSHYNDIDGKNLVNITQRGFGMNDGDVQRVLLGKYATRVGFWITRPGVDVIDKLGG